MRIKVNFFLLIVLPLYGNHTTLNYLLTSEKLVLTVPERMKNCQTDQTDRYFNRLYSERFGDFDSFILPDHKNSIQECVKQELKKALEKKEISAYHIAALPHLDKPELITIQQYLKEVPQENKEIECEKIAESITRNTIIVENILFKIFYSNLKKFTEEFTIDEYIVHIVNIRQNQEELKKYLFRALKKLS